MLLVLPYQEASFNYCWVEGPQKEHISRLCQNLGTTLPGAYPVIESMIYSMHLRMQEDKPFYI